MKTFLNTAGSRLKRWLRLTLAGTLVFSMWSQASFGATTTIFSEGFEGYTGAATNLADLSDAGFNHPNIVFFDDNPSGGTDGSGVQLIDWQVKSGTNAVLLRSSSEMRVNLVNAQSGSQYQFDFWLYVEKGAGDRNFYIILRGEGADFNGEDYIAYRSDRAASPSIFYYDGVGPDPAGWVNTGAVHTESTWQHHRMVINPATQSMDLYIEDMTTPVVSGAELARVEVPVPTVLRIVNEGNSADDGYFIIDDISLTVEGAIDLTTTFTEGFESYPARTSDDDDADPAGPWITVEVEGTGSGKPVLPRKVQVVDSSVVPAHSGTKSLKLEGGQRAGSSIAWGVPPQRDVQITWWARVPASVAGTTGNYLRMSLYGAENGDAIAGDNALLGYGSRQAGLGDETSLTYYITGWVDSGVDYTPDTWEEYRLITHTGQGRYSIIKNPSSANPVVIVDRAPFIGTATSWNPVFMAAWSSSNGTDHPPVYIDDIEIKSLVADAQPFGEPYNVVMGSERFTNVTTLVVTNMPVGSVAVDPRDNTTILFTTDTGDGAIYRATKVASGNWTVDPTPIVTDLDRPSGLAVGPDGTIWWTHDYNNDYTKGVMRLKAPWASNSPEVIISDFGPEVAAPDDDAIDLTIAPTNFSGTIGQPNMVIVADRGANGDANNAVYYIDPTTIALSQSNYVNYLVQPTTVDMGTLNLNAITALPQSGEVVTLSTDGFITAIDADGMIRYIWTTELWVTPPATPAAVAIAADPVTGRVWVADDSLDEIWSITPDGSGPEVKEISFELLEDSVSEWQIDFHDPGMTFSPDGKFMVVTDGSIVNGGARLHIFHNEAPAFRISNILRSATGVELSWDSAGAAATYRVQRSMDLANPAGFQNISDPLTATQFTDTNPPEGAAFYRVVVTP